MKYMMKNSIIQDNRLAQAVKIILFLATFFIFWSALALISSIYQPLSISWPITPEIGTSSTLADSLYQEIIQSYFSLFTISVLIISLLAGILGFRWSRQVSELIFPFHENQSPIRVFLNRLLNGSPHRILDFSNPDTIKQLNSSGSQIYGPAKILIQDGALGLISKGVDNFRVMISNGSSPIQISSSERLVELLPFTPTEFFVDLFNPTSNDFFNSIQLRYSFDIHNLAKSTNPSFVQFLSSNNFLYGKDVMDLIIRLEFDSWMKTEKKYTSKMTSFDGQDLSIESEKTESRSLPHSIYFLSKPLIKSKIIRNRKRRIYPLAASDTEILNDLESMRVSSEKLNPLMNNFFENLTRTTIHLFGFNPIKIIEYEIGKEK
jgi:hypothetical protein